MFRAMKLGLGAAALLGMPATLGAASVPWLVDTNTSAVIFDDNFESPLGVVGSTPVPAVGSWNFAGATGKVTDAATAGFAANEGSQFLQVNRSGSTEIFGPGVAANSGAGDDIALTLAFRGGAGVDAVVGALEGSTVAAAVGINVTGDGTVRYLVPGVAWFPLTQTYNVDAWNTAVITHTNGTNVYMLSINGAEPESVGAIAAASNFNGVYLTSAGNAANPFYFDSATQAVVAHPGDFDGDGVDGADFVAWQTHFPTSTGATLADGDADADGDVDGADFVVWQTNFPFTPGPAVSPIPEPGSFVLALLSAVFAAAPSCRKYFARRSTQYDRSR